MTQNIDLKNLGKSTWKTFRFDEIANKVSETVNPNTTDLTVYVGLEHIDADSIHLKRRGTPAEVSGGKLKCYPGDVIFGKRRAYQRKAAIVDFDGICSAHAFVLRAIPEVIDPMLFPFFLHSDLFMHRMVDISVGGLSPTINWGQLKEQEFLLPPKDKQAQLAKLLWAMDAVIESGNEILERLKIMKETLIKYYFSKAKTIRRIDELGKVITGNTPSTKNDSFWGGEIPFISPADIDESVYVNKSERFLTDLGSKKSRIFPVNSILTVCIGSTIGKVAINKVISCSNQQINILVPFKNYNPIYLLYLLRYHKPKIIAKTGATAVPIINKSDFSSMKIPVLDETISNCFTNEILKADASIVSLEKFIESSKALQKSLINQIF